MIFRQIIILIISTLVLFFSYNYLSKDYCPTCCSYNTTTAASIPKTTSSPLLFAWNNDDAITAEGFEELRANILAEGSDGEAIEITGHYFADEQNDTEFENLGLARAVAVSELLLEKNSDLNIITKSSKIAMREGVKANNFESISYMWITNEESVQERVEVDELGDAKILFPFNSSDKLDNTAVDKYLDNLAKNLNADSKLKVYIVGHTDSLGEPGSNRRLSERRAKKIRDILKAKGVPHRQIVPSGRGEADPVAPNTSEASRQLNRRVEIKLK